MRNTSSLQTLAQSAGPGGRWLVMESVSRAVSLATASSGSAHVASKAAASKLAALLARVAMLELRLRPNAFFSEKGDAQNSCAVGGSDLLRYLRVCAAHLPRPERPSSLYAEDHLTAVAQPSSNDDPPAPSTGIVADADPLLGDVLVSILKATAVVPEGTGSGAVWEAVSAVVLHGYRRRPLCALAAVAVDGISSSLVYGREGRRSSRQQRRGYTGVADGKVLAASRALCIAATFVRATEEAVSAGDTIDDDDNYASAERDLVAVFPAAVLAVASDDKVR